jgi:hypothetical protein
MYVHDGISIDQKEVKYPPGPRNSRRQNIPHEGIFDLRKYLVAFQENQVKNLTS